MSGTGTVLTDGHRSGLGFPLLPFVVVTAWHVVDPIADPVQAESLTYVPDGAPPVAVLDIRIDRDLDVAILTLAEPVPPFPGWSGTKKDARWEVDGRWLENDPLLTGKVTSTRRTVRLDGAEQESEVMQLLVEQHVGGHSGYSGSPVVDVEGRVLGVLVEQVMSREEQLSGATDVLYAVPIGDIVQRFDLGGSTTPSIDLSPPKEPEDSQESQTPWARRGPWVRRPPLPHPVGTEIRLLAFSPLLDTLATGGSDGTVRLWDTDSEQHLKRSISHTDRLRRLTFSGNGELFATLSGNQARVWIAGPDDEPIWSRTSATHAFDIALHPSDRLVAMACEGHESRICDITTGEDSPLADHLLKVALNPNGRGLAAYSIADGTLVWRLAGHQPQSPYALGFTGQTTRSNPVHFTYSCLGRWLITVFEDPSRRQFASAEVPHTIWIHDANTGVELGRIDHARQVTHLATSLDDEFLAVASNSRTVDVWHIGVSASPSTVDVDAMITGMGFGPDNRFLAVSTYSPKARVYTLEAGGAMDSLNHELPVTAMTVGRHGLVATSSGAAAFIWHDSRESVE